MTPEVQNSARILKGLKHITDRVRCRVLGWLCALCIYKHRHQQLLRCSGRHQAQLQLLMNQKEWGNFGFVPFQFLKLACQFCFSNNGQAAYNSKFILTLGFNSILWSFYNSQWLKKETYMKFCKKWLKRNIAKNGSHDIVKL